MDHDQVLCLLRYASYGSCPQPKQPASGLIRHTLPKPAEVLSQEGQGKMTRNLLAVVAVGTSEIV